MDEAVTLDAVAESLGLPFPIKSPEKIRFKRGDGKYLHALDWGNNGPPVLFLHGGKLTAHTWDLVCSLLRDRYHCIALDLRGHGESDWAEKYLIPDYVDDILHVLDSLGWKKLNFAGMSLGGLVAAHTMLENNFQGSTLALVDVAPGVTFETTSNLRDFMTSDRVKGGVPELLSLAREIGARGTEEQLRYRYNTLITRDGHQWRWKSDGRKSINFPHIFSYIDQLAYRATEMSWPVMLVRGGLSRILSNEAAEKFVAQCPEALLRVVDNAGHSVQEDNPLGLCQVLEEFWS